jgi:hypothetical protein
MATPGQTGGRAGLRAVLVTAVVAGTVVGLATTASAAKKPPKLSATEKGLFQYAACMRKKGVRIPDPVKGKDGAYRFPKIPAKVLNAPGVRQRAEACAAQLPRTLRRGNGPSAAEQAAFKKFTDCMAKNGVKLKRPSGQPPPQGKPPPQGQAPPNGQRRSGGFFNSKDPKVRKALAKCRKYLPAGFGRQQATTP